VIRAAELLVGWGVLDALVERSGSNPRKPHYALAQALVIAKARDFGLQRGWALCPCEPLLVDLPDIQEWAVDAAHIAKHAGLTPTTGKAFWPEPGELAGAVMMTSRHTRLLVKGRMLPDYTSLNTWRPLAVGFTSRDTLLFSATKPGGVLLWPVVQVEAIRLRRSSDEELGTSRAADLDADLSNQ
jgi:hypothetical protein